MTDKAELLALALLPERISSRIEVDAVTGCWNWNSPNSLVGRGRGYVSVNGKPMLHHRAIWTLLRGPIPSGAYLCHHCDNPRCGNPEHLYVGDSKTNVADMFRRGRAWQQKEPERMRTFAAASGRRNSWAKGASNPKAKLTPDLVEKVRQTSGSSYAVARQFGVQASTIQRIRNGKAWS